MAFEEHVVTASAAIGLTVDPLWYEQPVFYFTNPAAVRGPRADVAIPPGSAALDYELEVAAVIGREGADLSPGEAADHIAGFMLFCDWSARDLQAAEMRLNLGPAKGKDSANSFGPWLVTADELAPLASGHGYDVTLTATVNGVPATAAATWRTCTGRSPKWSPTPRGAPGSCPATSSAAAPSARAASSSSPGCTAPTPTRTCARATWYGWMAARSALSRRASPPASGTAPPGGAPTTSRS